MHTTPLATNSAGIMYGTTRKMLFLIKRDPSRDLIIQMLTFRIADVNIIIKIFVKLIIIHFFLLFFFPGATITIGGCILQPSGGL